MRRVDESQFEPRSRTAAILAAIDHTPAELLRLLPAGVVLGVVGAATGGVVARRLGVAHPAGELALLALGAVAGFGLGMRSASRIATGTARAIGSAVLPRGHTTPPVADYSREDALLMQRDVAGALESFERMIAEDPHLVGARLRAADLYAGDGKDLRRAEDLYRQVQRTPGVSARDDIYASNRLVDLYAGPLGGTGRAVVELRRLVERHAGTRAADEARRGLATLKERLNAERKRMEDG